MFKNTASQKLTVIAFADAGHATLDAGEPVTGDAANITMKIEQDDDGTQSSSNDVNPTEVEDGQYRFDLTQAETNGDKLTFYPQSSTAGVQVVVMPSNVIYTRPPNFAALGIETDGDLTKVNTVATVTTLTNLPSIPAGWLTAAGIAASALNGKGDWSLATVCTEARLAELDAANLPADVDALVARSSVRSDTAQAGAAGSITLDLGASAVDGYYDNLWCFITSGAGVGQVRMIKDGGYTGATKVALVDKNWSTAPDITSKFTLLPTTDIPISTSQATQIADAVETAIVNEGDATAVLQAIADQIAADWVAGDASPVAIAAAVRTNLATELGRIDVATSTRLSPTVAARTLDITAGGAAGIDWGNVENPSTSVDLAGTNIQLCDTVTTLTGHTAQTGDSFARLGAPAGVSVSADIATVDGNVDTIHSFIVQDYNGDISIDASDIAVFKSAIKAAADWTDGERLDLLLDELTTQGDTNETKLDTIDGTVNMILFDTDELQTDNVPGLIATAQADLDIITGADGATLATSERTSLATVLEAAMLDEGDASALLAAISAKVEEFLINEGDATATLAAIATAVWGAATRTLTANTNLNDPTAAAIASQVRTELTTELGRVDVAISTRNSTTPPTVGEIDTELTTNHGSGAWTSGGAGSGARTVTLTIDDGTTALESAKVRVVKGAEDYVQPTDVNGQVVFNLDDGSWTVSITLPGYTYAGTTLVVDGTEAETYSMTQVTSSPPSASTSTGACIVLDEKGVAEEGVNISVMIIDGPGTAGFAYDSTPWTKISDSSGLVEFAGLIRGATYRVYRGSVQEKDFIEFTVPDSSSFNISEVIGRP